MNIDLIVTDEAERDITEAFSWYEERRAGLGEDFLSCLDASIQGLRRMPEMHPVAYKSYRRALFAVSRTRCSTSSKINALPSAACSTRLAIRASGDSA